MNTILNGIGIGRTSGTGCSLPLSCKVKFCLKHPDLLIKLAYHSVLIGYLVLKVRYKEFLCALLTSKSDSL